MLYSRKGSYFTMVVSSVILMLLLKVCKAVINCNQFLMSNSINLHTHIVHRRKKYEARFWFGCGRSEL